MAGVKQWRTEGFEAFRRGSFGNGGQNIFVSRAGLLQRIHRFDLNGNGFVDLVFCNSQSHYEKPDTLIYTDPLSNRSRYGVRTHGCRAATVADLNGDGYDDLVLGSFKDGLATDLNAMVYYGSPDGLTESYHIELPAPRCTAVAAGDFDGDGRVDLAFLTDGRVRLFYQTEVGFEIKRFTDYAIQGQQLETYDLDADGYADLIVREAEGAVRVYWGGRNGLDSTGFTVVPVPLDVEKSEEPGLDDSASAEEYVAGAEPMVRVVSWNGVPHLFCPLSRRLAWLPILEMRSFGRPIEMNVHRAFAAAVGDVNGDGFEDLIVAARDMREGDECSWIYWGGRDVYSDERRMALPSRGAADVAVAVLSDTGFADVLITQNRSEDSFTTRSLIYRGSSSGIDPQPIALESHDARRGFIARTSDASHPQVILTSNFAGSASDELENTIYFGSETGYSEDDKLSLPGWGSICVLSADLRDSGYTDLVFANGSEFSTRKDPGSYVYYSRSNQFSRRPDCILPTSAATAVASADLNHNGYLDLVFCGFRKPEVLIFPGGPQGPVPGNRITIPLEHQGRPYGFIFSAFLVDLNRNGWLDLVVGGGNEERALVLWGGSDGFSSGRCQALAAYMPRSITAADFNGNGYPDLIIGARKPQLSGPHDAFLHIYWNGPEGLREDRKTVLPVKASNGLAVGDFNRDGTLDIFAGAYSDGRERDLESYLYWNRRNRGFTLFDRACLQTHAVGGCLAADLDEDGWLDLVVTNHKVLGNHNGYSEIWWNGPEGFSVDRTTPLATVGARGPSLVCPGNLLDRGPEEYYVSVIRSFPRKVSIEGMTWKAEVPPKTWVNGQVRVADSEEALSARPWTGPDGEASWWKDSGSDHGVDLHGTHVQFRLALGAVNGVSTPRVGAVTVHYRSDSFRYSPS